MDNQATAKEKLTFVLKTTVGREGDNYKGNGTHQPQKGSSYMPEPAGPETQEWSDELCLAMIRGFKFFRQNFKGQRARARQW